MRDYEKIETAIKYIRNNVGNQPSLNEIASQVHLSTYHFQRLFSRWAGVSPKRYLQVLTLQTAKQLLNDKPDSVLTVSDAVGLSSSSRLYDHFVQLDAITPSEYKQAGQGMSIHYGTHPTPYGEAFIAITTRGICKLSFIYNQSESELYNELQQEWPNAELVDDPLVTASVVQSMFEKVPPKQSPLSILVRGTNFQINVWRALLNLRQGTIASYSEIAEIIGKPAAARAIGTAIGKNPIAYIIPCHRVIQQSGGIGGYRWGETRKHAMLARETAPRG